MRLADCQQPWILSDAVWRSGSERVPRSGARLDQARLVPPQLPVDATHSLLVIAGYVVVLVAAAMLVTWRRDALE